MSTRRDFLRSLLGAGALAGLGVPVWAQERVLQMGFLLPKDSSAARGATLGFEEAKRTADLLHVTLRAASTSEGVEALIGLQPPAGELRVPFFAAGEPETAPVRPRVFRVASSPRFRRQILARQTTPGLRVVDWHPDLERFGAEQLNDRFRRRFGQAMDESAWRGWMAVKIAAELALRIPPGASTGLLEMLQLASFDGHKGTQLRFDPQDHYLVQPVYLVDGNGKLVGEAGTGDTD
ncbi:MAG TPA: twin-arginine translocation signal domain-containing protein [Thermoanaerobaculia bacterium]|nr:twin-arginine translocation signal domain-containing protein [Thermoanaerobaculia bacterium]